MFYRPPLMSMCKDIVEQVHLRRFWTKPLYKTLTYDPEATRVELDMETFGLRVFRADSNEPAWSTETLVEAGVRSMETTGMNHIQVKGHHPPTRPGLSPEEEKEITEYILQEALTGNKYFYASIAVKLWQVDTYLGYPMGNDEYRKTIQMDRIHKHHANLMEFVGGMGERVLHATKEVVSQYLSEDEMQEVEWIWAQLPHGGDPTHNRLAERQRQVRESCASSAA